MSPDIEDLLRSQLRGAASGAPHHLGVAEQDVLTRGRRAVRRRRALAAVGAVAATLAIAGTIGVLAPRPGDTDTLPALPTPTLSHTPEVTPTVTPTATPSTSVTTSASPTTTGTVTPNPTSAPTTASPGPSGSPAPRPTRDATQAGGGWSDPVSIAGRTYRVRLVPSSGSPNHDLELRAGETSVFTPGAVFNTEGRWGVDEADPRFAYYLGGARLVDLVSVKGVPVDDEVIGHVPVPTPAGNDLAGEPYMDLVVTVFRTASPNAMGPSGPDGWVVRFANGGLWDLGQE